MATSLIRPHSGMTGGGPDEEEGYELKLEVLWLFDKKRKGHNVEKDPRLREVMGRYDNSDLIGWYKDLAKGLPLRPPGKQRKSKKKKKRKRKQESASAKTSAPKVKAAKAE